MFELARGEYIAYSIVGPKCAIRFSYCPVDTAIDKSHTFTAHHASLNCKIIARVYTTSLIQPANHKTHQLTKAAFPFGLIGARPPPSTSSMPQNASSHVQSTAPIQGGPPPGALTPGFGNTYTFYQGDGSNWPPVSEWVDFYTMWEANEGMMNKSCTTMGGWGVKDNSPTENEDILEAISEEAKATGVDQRFILAVIVSTIILLLFLPRETCLLLTIVRRRCKNPKAVCAYTRPPRPAPRSTIRA